MGKFAPLARTLVDILQRNPVSYKKFGPYWWPVKAMIKAEGYDKSQLSLLGDYEDTDTAEQIPERADMTEMLSLALDGFNQSTYTGILASAGPGGEPYVPVDEDSSVG